MANNLFDPKMYKHVSSDDHKTVLQHKAGHSLTIAHNVLSKDMQKQLKALANIPKEDQTEGQRQEAQDSNQYGKVLQKAEGGGVERDTVLGVPIYGTAHIKGKSDGTSTHNDDGEWPLPSQTPVGKAIQQKKDDAEAPQAECSGGKIQKMAEGGQTLGDAIAQQPLDTTQMPTGPQQPQMQVDPEAPIISPIVNNAANWLMSPEGKALPEVHPADVAATTADAQVDNLKAQENQAQQVADATHQQAAAQASTKPQGMDTSPEGLAQHGMQAEVQGATEMGKAVGDLGKAKAVALEQDVARKQDISQAYQKSFQQLDGERKAHISDIQHGYIDPDQYWKGNANGNGSHSKIAAGIGMILAGFNPTSRPNAAMEFLNHQMDRNIDAQKANLGAKHNLLMANLQQFKNLQDATDMTRVMQADVIKNQLEQAAATAASPMAAAAAKTAVGQIDAKYQPIFMQLQIRHMMQGLGNGGVSVPGSTGQMLSGLDVVAPEQAKTYRERYYQPYDVPGGKSIADRPIEPAVRAQLVSQDKFDNAANTLKQLIQKHHGVPSSAHPVDAKLAEQQSMILQSLFREGTLGTVYKQGEQPLLDKAVSGNPMDLTHYFTELPKLDGLIQSNKMMKDTTLNSYGLTPPQSAKQQATNPMEGKTASDAKGNKITMKNGKWVPVGR